MIYRVSIVVFLLSISFAFPQGIRQRIFVETTEDEFLDYLKYGVDEEGTAGIDTLLEEEAFPRFPPPGDDLFGVFEIEDDSAIAGEKVVWSRTDIKRLENAESYFKQYDLYFRYAISEYLIFSWPKLHEDIDSAKLTDNFGAGYINIDMRDSNDVTIENSLSQYFVINVWYRNPDYVGVEDDGYIHTGVKIYPNPCADVVKINSESRIKRINIYDPLGREVRGVRYPGFIAEISISGFPGGVYLAVVELIDGNTETKPFLKIY